MKKAEQGQALAGIGFGNFVATAKVVAVASPAGAPMKRLRDFAKERGMLVDATEGRRTRSVIIMESGHVVLSALLTETVSDRIAKGAKADDEQSPEAQ